MLHNARFKTPPSRSCRDGMIAAGLKGASVRGTLEERDGLDITCGRYQLSKTTGIVMCECVVAFVAYTYNLCTCACLNFLQRLIKYNESCLGFNAVFLFLLTLPCEQRRCSWPGEGQSHRRPSCVARSYSSLSFKNMMHYLPQELIITSQIATVYCDILFTKDKKKVKSVNLCTLHTEAVLSLASVIVIFKCLFVQVRCALINRTIWRKTPGLCSLTGVKNNL